MRRTDARSRSLGALLACALLGACQGAPPDATPGSWRAGISQHSAVIDGDTRTYLLHVPLTMPRGRFGRTRAEPLLLLLHGSGASGETVRTQSGMDALSDSLHVIVAYPDATGPIFHSSDWNAGDCCGNAQHAHVDDVGFLRAVIRDVGNHLPVDVRRIYVAGFSDGGRMAYHFACVDARDVAAIGVVAGSVVDASCHPARAVPLIAFHGTADDEVPWTDSVHTAPPAPPIAAARSLPPSIQFWSAVNRCTGLSSMRLNNFVVRHAFTGCAAPVVLFAIDSAGHSWPGGKPDGAGGNTPSAAINASATLMQFLLAARR